MSITLDGTNGITTPDVTSTGLTADTTTLVVDDVNDRVGIGTSSPGAKLDVQGRARFIASSDAYGLELRYSSGSTPVWVGSPASEVLAFYRSGGGIETARIDSSGNLLVGNTSGARGKLYVRYDVASTSLAPIHIQNESVGGNAMIFATNGDSTVGRIVVNISSTQYLTSSDYRLKEDWVAVSDASTRVKALKPVNFAWKIDGKRVDGFLAHELAEVVPEAVSGEKDAVDADGKPVYQGIDQSKLVPLLTAALQEALTKIDEQQQAIAGLTARVEALEGAQP